VLRLSSARCGKRKSGRVAGAGPRFAEPAAWPGFEQVKPRRSKNNSWVEGLRSPGRGARRFRESPDWVAALAL